MKNNKRCIIIVVSLLFLSGCQNKTIAVNDSPIKATKPQQSSSTNISTVSNNDDNESINNADHLLLLNIIYQRIGVLIKVKRLYITF